VFTDVDSIDPGDDFAEAITAAVSSCGVPLALIGKLRLSSIWLPGWPDRRQLRKASISAAPSKN
jgi:hypothetical protein